MKQPSPVHFPIQLKGSEMSWATVNSSRLEMNWVAHYCSGRVRDERLEEWAGEGQHNVSHYMPWSGYLEQNATKMVDFWNSLQMWLLWENRGLCNTVRS